MNVENESQVRGGGASKRGRHPERGAEGTPFDFLPLAVGRDIANGAAAAAGNVVGAAADAFNNAADVIGKGAGHVAKRASSQRESVQDKRPHIELRVPEPLLDERERRELDEIAAAFKRMREKNLFDKMGKAAAGMLPRPARNLAKSFGDAAQAQDIYKQAMEYVAKGYKILEEQAIRLSLDEGGAVAAVNKHSRVRVERLEELCLLRSYDLARTVQDEKSGHLATAFAEGLATGVPGFAGIPFNLACSTFLYYRAVQSIAMLYGFDVRGNAEELVIAGQVFAAALTPGESEVDGMSANITKIMALGQAALVRDAVKKGWTEAARQGGIPLVIVQLRALASKTARNALDKAGKKGLEASMFQGVFRAVGKKLGQKTVQRAIPVVGGVIGGTLDTVQMSSVLEYADMFYRKRFTLEKEIRIAELLGLSEIEIAADEISTAEDESDADC